MKSNRILLKAAEFHRISGNQQDITQFHKIQNNFTKSNRIIEIQRFQRMSWNHNRILLKAKEFYRISLNSLQISLEINHYGCHLWILLQISLADFTADFMWNFTADFLLIPSYFIIDFMTNFITSNRILLKLATEFYRIPLTFITGFHWNQQDFTMGVI